MRNTRILVLLFLGICLASVLAAEILSQNELRELDIFLQDDNPQQINRIKRTDEDIHDEAEHSGEVPPGTTELFNANDSLPNVTETNPDSNPEDSPPESTNVEVTNSSQEGAPTEVPPIEDPITKDEVDANESTNSDNSVLTTPEPTSNSTDAQVPVAGIREVIASDDTQVPVAAIRGVVAGDEISSSNGTINATENITEPASSNVTIDATQNITEVPSNNDTVNATQDITETASSNGTLNATQNITEITSSNGTLNATQNITDINVPTNNATNVGNSTIIGGSETPAVNSTGVQNSTEIKQNSTLTKSDTMATAKPVTVETDQTKQSSVSGSGVLFTIIVLAVIAGLAAGGYVIYKRRRRGYDPVNVEDQDKEMTEVKSENGYGKPIKEEEVRLQGDLTPTQPLAAPRTFAVTPNVEKKMDDMETHESSKTQDETRENIDHEYKKDEQQ